MHDTVQLVIPTKYAPRVLKKVQRRQQGFGQGSRTILYTGWLVVSEMRNLCCHQESDNMTKG